MATALAAGAGRVSAQTSAPPGATQSVRITPENARLSNYLHDLAGPGAFVGVIGGGLVDQLRDKNDAVGGLGGRLGSNVTQAVVQTSVRHSLAALMHRSTDYQPCNCQGFGRKVGHALLETFTDRRADGTRALSVPRIAGAYAGGFSRMAWERDRSGSDVMLGTTASLGFSALFNIARELIR